MNLKLNENWRKKCGKNSMYKKEKRRRKLPEFDPDTQQQLTIARWSGS